MLDGWMTWSIQWIPGGVPGFRGFGMIYIRSSVFAGLEFEVMSDNRVRCSASQPNWKNIIVNDRNEVLRLGHGKALESRKKQIARVESMLTRAVDLASTSWGIEGVYSLCTAQLYECLKFEMPNGALNSALGRLHKKYQYPDFHKLKRQIADRRLKDLFSSTEPILIEREKRWCEVFQNMQAFCTDF